MAKINIQPEIMKFQISSLVPWEENPRDISPEALKGLRDSLEKFGYVDLIVVNKRNMQVVSGHQRLRVLKEDGVQEVTCLAVDMDEIAQNALAVTLNNQQITGFFTKTLIPILEPCSRNRPSRRGYQPRQNSETPPVTPPGQVPTTQSLSQFWRG